MATTVLIVHDDPGFFENTKAGLAAACPDCEVVGAISGPRALGMARQHRPDVIIADGDLEGMDGYAFTSELKSDSELASIPVLIVANDPTDATALKARQAGAASHLPATIETVTLVQKVLALTGAAAAAPAAGSGAPDVAVAGAPAPSEAVVDPQGVASAVAEPVGSASYGAPQELPPGYGAPATEAVAGGAGGPTTGDDVPHVDDLLRLMIDLGGSDLHITVGSPPGIRVRGEITRVENAKTLTPKDTQQMLLSLLSEEQRKRFETELELDFAYSIPGLSRFRTNVFQQRNSMGAVFRVIPLRIPTLEDLQLPRVCKFLAERPRGLVLVTGPTGSGKSTTLAAMIDHINDTRMVHIITMEDPIEFMHKNKKAFVNQREVGEDTHSFTSALKRVLRQDPDVILVGEMRDLETIAAALTAAETGHLVLATLHTTGGPETVDRIIDVFPPHQQQQVRMQLSTTLEGVLSQTLLRSTDGKSRVMAMEIMLGIPAISNLIREGKTHQMATIIQGGSSMGMQTLDQHLKVLLQAGKITYEEAIQKAKEPRELAQMVGRKI
ncbi:MAG: PilT/PilU family type 4a pilus ATPase [Actinobacteria bacterium]|nr:PilT/PilU family type 4a pilus ATPase [Actinomycetota bacterium]